MNSAEVAATLREQFPELGQLPVTRLGEGEDHVAFDVGGRFVFRFPKNEALSGALRVEVRLLAWLAPHLPLPIPEYRFLGRPGARFPRGYAGYPKLPGVPALLAPAAPLHFAHTGRRLGEFLRALHDQSVHEAAALGLDSEDDDVLGGWSSEALDDLSFALARGFVSPAEAARWAHALKTPPAVPPATARVLHGDFAAEHVLLDGNGVPCSVIDWSDAALGDPARDFAGLVHWGGARLLTAALDAYGDLGEGGVERARWFALCRALGDLKFGETLGRAEYLRAGQRALAWLAEDFY